MRPTNIAPKDRIVLPLDVSDLLVASKLVRQLSPHVGMFKLGFEFIYSTLAGMMNADFETANTAGVDVTVVGAEVYAAHWATEILCLVVKSDVCDSIWVPGGDETHLRLLAEQALWDAHNASFEMAIWHHIMVAKFGFPEIPLERWDDTMAVCAVRGLPLGLDKAAKALDLGGEKDKEKKKQIK